MYCAGKLKEIKEVLQKGKVDGFLITNEINIRYITDFTGTESILLITPDHDYLFTDFRYIEQAQKDVPWVRIVERKTSLIKIICGKLKRLHVKKLYVESPYITFDQYREITKNVRKIQIIPSQGIIEHYRRQKTKEEINKIQAAIDIAERAYQDTRKGIRIGLSEKKMADTLESKIRKRGGFRSSFEIICAVGPRASQPHARPTDKKIQEGDVVLIDWGASFQFYNSDLTRVCFIYKISPEFKRIYQIVLDAQSFAIDIVRPGIKAKDVDVAARNYIEKKGFGKYFGHGLGHGIGLEVHEGPFLNKKSREILKEFMVFTIEPGIYIPGWGGIRIEDMVLVTPDGFKVLSHAPKKLAEIVI